MKWCNMIAWTQIKIILMKIPLYEFLCCLLGHHFGFLDCLCDHGPDFFQANRQIPHLVATLLWGHNQLTSPVYLILVLKGWENVMWPLKPPWNCLVLTLRHWNHGWKGRVGTIRAIFCLTASGIQSADARWNRTSALEFTGGEKQGLYFHVTACLPQIYEIIQPDLCWLSTWDTSMMNFLEGHNSFLTVFLYTTLQDKPVPVMVFAFLDTTEFIASHCLPHF